ncbi:MAG TPA: diguanylate cyclase [Bryobacteraceae bacterium]|nr:diguanylate cyclase [Bryobacteraceae bacterium]
MSLTTLKAYLTGTDEDGMFRRVISLLLQGISLHAVEGDRADYDRFRNDFERIQASLGKEASGQELLVATGAANQALADYGQRTTRFIRQQGAVLHNMISMLTQTMVSIGAGSESSAEHLQAIEKELAHAVVIEDVQTLKLRLGECLKNLREEVVRQKAQAREQARHLQQHVEHAHDCVQDPPDIDGEIDSATGLRTRSAAKTAFHAALQTAGRKYVVAAVVNRIQSVNRHFGYAVGDQLLKKFSDLFGATLAKTDRLFRWRGPALVALLEREESIHAVQAEIRRINSKRIEGVLEVGEGALLPVSASWLVLALDSSAADMAKAIEKFIASQVQIHED